MKSHKEQRQEIEEEGNMESQCHVGQKTTIKKIEITESELGEKIVPQPALEIMQGSFRFILGEELLGVINQVQASRMVEVGGVDHRGNSFNQADNQVGGDMELEREVQLLREKVELLEKLKDEGKNGEIVYVPYFIPAPMPTYPGYGPYFVPMCWDDTTTSGDK